MKVDYDKIAPNYDRHRQASGPYMPQLVALAGQVGARKALELGCGTGKATGPFVAGHPCCVTALDLSRGMLEEARAKPLTGVSFIQANAAAVPLRDGAFDFIYGVFFIHHVPDLAAVARECARVLRTGAVAIVTASTGFIRSHPMNRYFPSVERIDLERFRTGEEIAAAFQDAGFARAQAASYKAQPQPIDDTYVQKVADKFTSTYELISAEEFEQGLARLRADVANNTHPEKSVQWEWTLVTALK